MQIWKHGFQSTARPFNWTVSQIGQQILSTDAGGFALPFEAVSMLLLAAMIGCIVIAMKAAAPTNGKPGTKALEEIKKEEQEKVLVNEISEL